MRKALALLIALMMLFVTTCESGGSPTSTNTFSNQNTDIKEATSEASKEPTVDHLHQLLFI